MKTIRLSVLRFAIMAFPLFVNAQQAIPSATAAAVVPRLVSFSGKAVDAQGKPLSGTAGVTFGIYKDQTGGTPLWMETQNVQADSRGNYSIQLGSTKSDGLPVELFASGEARWLGVRVNGGEEQPRVMLLSVPYALKAGDAATIGGLPPSAFMLAGSPQGGAPGTSVDAANSNPAAGALPPASTVTTSGGTVNTLPLWTTATNVQSSAITQTGSGATAKIGINTTAPTTALDVHGGSTIHGTLVLPATGVATASAGKVSQAENFVASSFSSATSTPVNQTFQWQATPASNNTSNPGATLNLLYGLGATPPAQTGLRIGPKGIIGFAAGQTFPGTGTVNSVGFSAPSSDFTVTGSPVTGSGTLGLSWNVAPTSSNVANAIVKRDALGNFTAGDINVGVIGANNSADGGIAVYALDNSIGGFGMYAQSDIGTGIQASGGSYGVFGIGDTGVHGFGNSVGISAYSPGGQALVADTGVGNTSDTLVTTNEGGGFPFYAGGTGGGVYITANGDLVATGSINGSSKNFRVDHPLDPENKYLYHASVESSEMMNIYTGNVTTNGQGLATVQLPDWFEAVNADLRYQLTVMGQFAQAIVADEVANHRFSIKTDKPNVKVSWLITGVRQDAYAKAHPLVVEQEKLASERGRYVHPELYGAPREKSVDWAHHPKAMQPPNAPRVPRSPTAARAVPAKP